jgi:hypothetical protein
MSALLNAAVQRGAGTVRGIATAGGDSPAAAMPGCVRATRGGMGSRRVDMGGVDRPTGAVSAGANAVNPGGVVTGLQRNFSAAQRRSLAAAEAAGVFTYKTLGQGAATTLVAAVAPEFYGRGGRYLDDCREAYTVPDDATLSEHPHGVKQLALDPTAADRLRRRSLDMIT